jgi:hypothetical protein
MWWCLSIFFSCFAIVSAMITPTLLLYSWQLKPLNFIFPMQIILQSQFFESFFAAGAVVISRSFFVFISFFICRCPSNRSEYEDSSHQDEFQQDQNYWRFLPGNLFYMQNCTFIAKLPEKNSQERWTSVRSYKPILPQNGAIRSWWTPAHSTCRAGPSCKNFSHTLCFVHRVDANRPVFRDRTAFLSFLYTVV